jgi:flotillin
MSHAQLVIIGAAAIVVYLFVFMAIWASRYTKVGLNQVLIVSGRQVQLPDGKRVGFRIVKAGGTFVWPVFERADVLSLEVFTVEMPKSRVRTAQGEAVEVDCVAQTKIKGDDISIIAAAEHFLSKSTEDVKSIVKPVLEKHLRAILGSFGKEAICQNFEAFADNVQAAASVDLGKMGLGIVSFTIQDLRTV